MYRAPDPVFAKTGSSSLLILDGNLQHKLQTRDGKYDEDPDPVGSITFLINKNPIFDCCHSKQMSWKPFLNYPVKGYMYQWTFFYSFILQNFITFFPLINWGEIFIFKIPFSFPFPFWTININHCNLAFMALTLFRLPIKCIPYITLNIKICG